MLVYLPLAFMEISACIHPELGVETWSAHETDI